MRSGSNARVGRGRRKTMVKTAPDGNDIRANEGESVFYDAAEWFEGVRRGHGV